MGAELTGVLQWANAVADCAGTLHTAELADLQQQLNKDEQAQQPMAIITLITRCSLDSSPSSVAVSLQ